MVIGTNVLWSVVWGFLFDVLLKGSNRFCSSFCFVAFALAFIGMLLVHSSLPS
jgi:Sec-independent protein secretion pathway component TatC